MLLDRMDGRANKRESNRAKSSAAPSARLSNRQDAFVKAGESTSVRCATERKRERERERG